MNLLETALSQYGVEEIPGRANNPVIINYAIDIGYGATVLSEKTAWCSIFINWCALKAGLERSGKLNARSWLDFGDEIRKPLTGDLVILWRQNKESWKGHVGIFSNFSQDGDFIHILGGNQSNRVQISAYQKERLLGFRRLGLKKD